MKKSDRHRNLLDIVSKNTIETQDMLVANLKERGINVTQATVSRDIKELKITKTQTANGAHAYSAGPRQLKPPVVEVNQGDIVSERLRSALNSGYISCDYADNIVVVKTIVGMAPPCALAIDAMKWPEVVGTIAGDDTIMVVTRSVDASESFVIRFNSLKMNKE
ncbi:MAG: arginine repressor [Oscillospiraceae bacterium]|nr:arginine repressor [Oscillospiraceae bacterium]